MAQHTTHVCDACGAPATCLLRGMTGRVRIDGRDHGQDVDLCDTHKPSEAYRWQPQSTDRIVFHWPGPHGENMYPKQGE